mmetsp:Transcript_12632/g.32713  ORF Transcript_12632/g.32713 Transcript_12632/m.32713 type:complete len:128 (-) Transcript_12632:64-447(-)
MENQNVADSDLPLSLSLSVIVCASFYGRLLQGFGVPDPQQAGMSTQTFSSAAAWLQIVAAIALSIGIRFTEKGLKAIFYPDDVMILSEKEVSKPKAARIKKSQENVLRMSPVNSREDLAIKISDKEE